MKHKRQVYVPHPLVSREHSEKMRHAFIADMQHEWQGLHEYFVDVGKTGDKRWAASHLVRAIADGLGTADAGATAILYEVANRLASRTLVKGKIT